MLDRLSCDRAADRRRDATAVGRGEAFGEEGEVASLDTVA
jgi:hypothetical protein